MSEIKWINIPALTGSAQGKFGPYTINVFGNGVWANWGIRRDGDARLRFGASLPEADEGGNPTLDAAKANVEQALRKLHDDLTAQFAPVLRWDGDSARFLCWSLLAQESGFWHVGMLHDDGVPFVSIAAGDDVNPRRAAEAALRALGVAFRTAGP